MKKFLGVFLALLLMFSALQLPASANFYVKAEGNCEGESLNQSKVYADWIFDEDYTKNGTSIDNGDLVVLDQSGNGNDITMQSYLDGNKGETINYSDYVSFANESMSSTYGLESTGSISLTPSGDTGVDFITDENAAINSETFKDGYTLEMVYYVPSSGVNNYSSIISRQGVCTTLNEPEGGTMNVALNTDIKVQYRTADFEDGTILNRDLWTANSAIPEKGEWYHIAITSDGEEIAIYVNGMDTVRGYYNEFIGMYADPDDGRFRIGSAYWTEDGVDEIDAMLKGNLERIRITGEVLSADQWLIPNPVDVVQPDTLEGNLDSYAMVNSEDNYNMVFIPDTQYVVQGNNSVMDTATDWLVENADEINVTAVMHLGDITESYNYSWSQEEEWENARTSFYKLAESGIETLMVQGNHDNQALYTDNFGAGSIWASTMDSNKPGLVTYEPEAGMSAYMIVEAGSYKYMVISIAYSRETTDVDWMKSVLDENPNIPTIIISHDIVTTSFGISSRGTSIWDAAKQYDQVFMVVGGHYNGYGYSTLTNDAGNDVFAILMDYQEEYMGGNAWFKFAEFAESENKIYLTTFSPYVASKNNDKLTYFDSTYLTGEGHDDVLEINFKERFNFGGVEISKTYKSMTVEDTYKLTANLSADSTLNMISPEFVWSSSDDSVATVDANGVITAVGAGTAYVTAALSEYGWLTNSCRVYVQDASEGTWMAGEYHTHTGMSPDVNNVSYATVENSLDHAFDTDTGYGLDYLILADHFRMTNSDAVYNPLDPTIAFYKALSQYQLPKIEELQASGKYEGKIIYTGFEMDLLGFDHVSVAILPDEGDDVLIDAIKEFEYYYSKDTKTSEFSEEDIANWGERKNSNDRENAYDAINWLSNNYPNSYLLLNHPSRYSGQDRSDELTISEIRKMNDLAPDTVFGFEGIPGNQLSGDGVRGELPYGYVYGGVDVMVSEVGGVWDALLGEGRDFWNFANSDFHFKINDTGEYASGYWPGEYSKNYTYVEGNDIQTVAEGLRSGKSFAVMGDLIDALDYQIHSDSESAEMGEHLSVAQGKEYTITIRFKSPETNNYEPITEDWQSDVTNEVSVDHVDLITGKVTGKLDESDYDNATNESTEVLARFTSDDWEVDEEGYCVITYTVDSADADRYYRLRGTNLGVDVAGYTINGEPVADEKIKGDTTEETFNLMNDRNYTSMWFYSNPIFVDISEEVEPELETHSAYIAGYEDGTVRPNGELTRAEAASILYNLLDDDAKTQHVTTTNSFSDVASSHWANKAISTLANMGVISGYPDATFMPAQSITRAEFSAMICEFNEIEKSVKSSSFSDISGHWAESYIMEIESQGWIAGYDDGTFRPNNNITRAETISIINITLNRECDATSIASVTIKEFPDNQDTSKWYYYAIVEATNTHEFEYGANGKEVWTSVL